MSGWTVDIIDPNENIAQWGRTAFRMNTAQRKLLADKLADLGNLAATALVFAELVFGAKADVSTVYLGIILYLGCNIAAYLLSK